jgi:hypothetical protein
MELLLWLYFYDDRWLFRLKMPVTIYKYIWILPLLLHMIEMCVSLYYLNISAKFNCENSVRLWLYHKTVFAFLMSLNIGFFIYKISVEIDRDNQHYEKGRKVYPTLRHRHTENDYWIRRNSLYSTPGILLLIQGCISLFWSYFITAMYTQDYNSSCDVAIQRTLNFNSQIILYTNCLIFLVFTLMVGIKITFNVLGQFYPKKLAKIADFFHCNTKNIKLYHTHVGFKDVKSI